MGGGRTIIRNPITMSFAQRSADINKQQTLAKPRPHGTKCKIKPSAVAFYVSAFVLVIAIIFIGYNEPQSSSMVANASNVSTTSQADQTSVDEVVATSVAATVADSANLPIASSISNMAISTQTKSEYMQSDSSTGTTKPRLIISSTTSRAISTYTVQAGDTVDTLSAKFGISKQTIKWANDLTSDALTVDTTLYILPVDGVLYTVKSGDTVDSIAEKYSVDKTRLVLYNDLDVSGLQVGTMIILPNATLPTDEQPGYIAPSSSYSYSGSYYVRSGSVGNLYALGNCTWYAYERRVQLGNPVGSYWGNANTWAISAQSTGYAVNHTPSAGAVLVDESGWYGHVAVVESVAANGDIVISEMNNYAYGGWNIVNNRTISAGQAELYKYIH